MPSKIYIDFLNEDHIKCLIVDEKNETQELIYTNKNKATNKENIYVGTITRAEASLQAAFVDYGKEKAGFLPFDSIHPIYFQIPEKDRKILENQINQTASASDENQSDDDIEQEEKNIFHEILSKKYAIQDVIKEGQLVLVQLSNDARGSKGATCTTFITLTGRFCVLKTNSPKSRIGISKKISDPVERKRILKIASRFNIANNASLIIRTAAAMETDKNLKNDFEYLKNLWSDIKNKAMNAKAGTLVYQKPDDIKQAILDTHLKYGISCININNKLLARDIHDFLKKFIPDDVKKIKLYQEDMPMFKKYQIDQNVEELLCERVNLKSGGYLIIDTTEALTSIDVNSGKAIQEKNLEQTALKTNLEACEEIPKQLRKRGVGGLIVIDFIDLEDPENRKKVENTVKAGFEDDRAKVQTAKISQFGLLEMSRQRVKSSLYETFLDKCENCHGTGRVKNSLLISNEIYETLQIKLLKLNNNNSQKVSIKIECNVKILEVFVKQFKDKILDLEKKYNIEINFHSSILRMYDNEFTIETTDKKEKLKNTKETLIAFENNRNKILNNNRWKNKIIIKLKKLFHF